MRIDICKRIITVLLSVALGALLCGCAERVDFEDKNVSVEKTEIALVLQEGETAKLDELPQLVRADLSGSTCYAEIMAWMDAHPDVEVTYTVAFPDGTVADNLTDNLALGAIAAEDAASAAELLTYLPELKTLDLTGTGLSPADAALLANACPDADITYTCTLLGQTLTYDTTFIDLTGITAADVDEAVSTLSSLPNLNCAALGTELECALSWEQLATLVQGCPNVDFDYSFTLYGKALTLLDDTLDLNHIKIEDNGALVRRVVAAMKNLTLLDMDFCGVSNEDMAAIRDAFPNVEVVWRVWFASNYSVRTNVEKILASKPSAGGTVTDRDGAVLKYCTNVKYLDLGHNEVITDISFVAYMPKLQVAILAMNNIKDLSPLANCTELEYLEIQTNAGITDLSPLANCTKLEHLNVANCRNFSDITPLMNLNNLKRLWLGCSAPVPQEQKDEFVQLHPDCEFNTTVWNDPTSEGWRIDHVDPWTNQVYYDERYEQLLEEFGYLEGDYSFISKDPLYNPHD